MKEANGGEGIRGACDEVETSRGRAESGPTSRHGTHLICPFFVSIPTDVFNREVLCRCCDAVLVLVLATSQNDRCSSGGTIMALVSSYY